MLEIQFYYTKKKKNVEKKVSAFEGNENIGDISVSEFN